MAKFLVAVLLVACVFSTRSQALQVSPNSKCAAYCMDDSTQDKSDPNVSNTKGSEIVCRDANYANAIGQKFEQCITCLQGSSETTPTESDLQWFLYNIRFAFTSCIYGLQNTTDPISTPCTIQSSCGPLVGPLQDGMDKPTAANRYSYCSAFNGLFLGPRLGSCNRCLSLTEEQKYIGNFLVALHAACQQKPEPGKLIGLTGYLFSTTPVNITAAASTPTPSPNDQNRPGLTTGAYIGIGVAGLVVLAVFGASLYIGFRKKRARQDRERVSSSLDDRYGHGRVTAPISGGFNDSKSKPTSEKGNGFFSRGKKPTYPPKKSPTPSPRSEEHYSPGRVQQTSPYAQRHAPTPSPGYTPFAQINMPSPPYATRTTPNPSPRRENHISSNRSAQNSPNQPIEMTRGVGAAAPYHPSAPEVPTPAYSPPMWAPPRRSSSPTSTAHSRTPLHRASASSASETVHAHAYTPSISVSPPVVGSGLPRPTPPLPARSNSNAAMPNTLPSRPGRHTRDLSSARGAIETPAGPSNIQISGPIVTVNTRFDEEEATRKRLAREKLWQQGFKKQEEQDVDSPQSAEMWPGNY